MQLNFIWHFSLVFVSFYEFAWSLRLVNIFSNTIYFIFIVTDILIISDEIHPENILKWAIRNFILFEKNFICYKLKCRRDIAKITYHSQFKIETPWNIFIFIHQTIVFQFENHSKMQTIRKIYLKNMKFVENHKNENILDEGCGRENWYNSNNAEEKRHQTRNGRKRLHYLAVFWRHRVIFSLPSLSEHVCLFSNK